MSKSCVLVGCSTPFIPAPGRQRQRQVDRQMLDTDCGLDPGRGKRVTKIRKVRACSTDAKSLEEIVCEHIDS